MPAKGCCLQNTRPHALSIRYTAATKIHRELGSFSQSLRLSLQYLHLFLVQKKKIVRETGG